MDYKLVGILICRRCRDQEDRRRVPLSHMRLYFLPVAQMPRLELSIAQTAFLFLFLYAIVVVSMKIPQRMDIITLKEFGLLSSFTYSQTKGGADNLVTQNGLKSPDCSSPAISVCRHLRGESISSLWSSSSSSCPLPGYNPFFRRWVLLPQRSLNNLAIFQDCSQQIGWSRFLICCHFGTTSCLGIILQKMVRFVKFFRIKRTIFRK